MSGLAGGFLQGLGGGMQQRQDREMRARELSVLDAMGQARGQPGMAQATPGIALPLDVSEAAGLSRQGGAGGRARAGVGSGRITPRAGSSTQFDNSVLETIENPQQARALELAASQLGMNERDQRAALSEFMKNGGHNLDPAVTAWCAAFVNASLNQAGLEGTGRLNARSFMDWGEATEEPQVGDIAVFSRGDPNGWQGHVGFFKGYDEHGNVRVLGGNQSDSVNIASYPRDRLLGYRRAPGQPQPLSVADAASQSQTETSAPTPAQPAAAAPPALGTTGAGAGGSLASAGGAANSWAWMRQMQQGAGT